MGGVGDVWLASRRAGSADKIKADKTKAAGMNRGKHAAAGCKVEGGAGP